VADIGSWALHLSLAVSLYGAIAALMGARQRSRSLVESAEKALWAVAALVTLASLILLYSLVTHDFQIKYVYQYTSTQLRLVYRISAFWAGEEGSLLLWLWFLAILTVLVAQKRGRSGPIGPYLLVTLAVTEAFFALLLLATGNPFETYSARPSEGVGMLPLLENLGMILHPPLLFLGYASYTVPFAFALSVLMSGQQNSGWVKAVRRWSLFAWISLSAGILTGAWWSYVELGWGGYWAWDPVENTSLIPWLIGTAFLHSAIMEEQRGMHRVWNMVLPALAFLLCLFATLVTRGGVIISDLHGFSRHVQPIVYFLLAFMAIVLGVTLSLIYYRRHQLGGSEAENLLSREGTFLLNNLLFCAAALIVFLGTVYPVLAQALRGVAVSLKVSFYNRALGPLMMAIICLIGICPMIGWQRLTARHWRNLVPPALAALVLTIMAFSLGVTELFPLISTLICAFVIFSLLAMVARDLHARHRATGENYPRALINVLSKAQRRYGAHLVHLAIVLMAIGVTGSTFYKREQLVTLKPGDWAVIGDYRVQYEDYAIETLHPESATYQSRIRYSTTLGIYQGQAKASTLVPEINYHWVLDNPWVTEVAIHSSLKEDLYIILADLAEDGRAGFQMIINPLVNWIWIGGGVLLVGTLIAAWPQQRARAEEEGG